MSTAPNRISRGGGPTTSMNSPSRRSDVSAHNSSSAIRAASSSSSGEPSDPERAPSTSTRSLAPGAAPSRTVTSAARPPERAISSNRLGSYASTQTSISPPHGRPTSQASESAIPKWSSCGGSPRITQSAISATAPSTHPPDTEPAISPCSLTAIFAPGGRGAERCTSITVASAIRSPRFFHNASSDRTSCIELRSPQG